MHSIVSAPHSAAVGHRSQLKRQERFCMFHRQPDCVLHLVGLTTEGQFSKQTLLRLLQKQAAALLHACVVVYCVEHVSTQIPADTASVSHLQVS
jgi:hypothetical protein